MLNAQAVGRPGNQRIEYAVAGKPKNVVDVVVFGPFNHFVTAIVTVTPPDQARLRPVLAYPARDMLDDRPHLRALRCLGGPQDRHHRTRRSSHDRYAWWKSRSRPRVHSRTQAVDHHAPRRMCRRCVEDLLFPRFHGAAERRKRRSSWCASSRRARGSSSRAFSSIPRSSPGHRRSASSRKGARALGLEPRIVSTGGTPNLTTSASLRSLTASPRAGSVSVWVGTKKR